LRNTVAAAATVSALSMTADSYARVAGANDRISIALIGCGERGTAAHFPGIFKHADTQNYEVTAVCDPWRTHREKAAEIVKDKFGREPRGFVSYRDVMALADVDAVMIASPDHHHTTHLRAAADAKKDVYCEKPLAKDFEKLKEAVDAVKRSGVVCQVGTQNRSNPLMVGCQKLYQTGILGTVSRIEQVRNGTEPYWYRYARREVKAEDVDWKEFQGDAPPQPFHPHKCAGWFGYREFCDGPVPQLGAHFIDIVHFITGATLPSSCVTLGNTYTWKDEYRFTTPDQVQTLWEYPEGFLVSYSSNFGNGSGNFARIFGNQGVLDLASLTAQPSLSADGGGNKNRGVIRGKKDVEPVTGPDHFLNWLQCLRTRKTPVASIDAGYHHAVACLMSVRAMDSGRRVIYDREKREIREG
jgi:predicted dehydrogenase